MPIYIFILEIFLKILFFSVNLLVTLNILMHIPKIWICRDCFLKLYVIDDHVKLFFHLLYIYLSVKWHLSVVHMYHVYLKISPSWSLSSVLEMAEFFFSTVNFFF